MLPIDLTRVLKDAPIGDWIALSGDQEEILGTGKTLDEALRLASERGEESPIVMKIPSAGALIL